MLPLNFRDRITVDLWQNQTNLRGRILISRWLKAGSKGVRVEETGVVLVINRALIQLKVISLNNKFEIIVVYKQTYRHQIVKITK